jgi:hypothetical protein
VCSLLTLNIRVVGVELCLLLEIVNDKTRMQPKHQEEEEEEEDGIQQSIILGAHLFSDAIELC